MTRRSDGVEVVEVPTEFRPAADTGSPLCWQRGKDAVVVFDTADGAPARRAVVEFGDCLQTRFGYPDEESLAGHPFYDLGLRHLGLFEVRGSSPWIDELSFQHRAAFPRTLWWPERTYHHFVLVCPDATFEALCCTLDAHTTDETPPRVFERLSSL